MLVWADDIYFNRDSQEGDMHSAFPVLTSLKTNTLTLGGKKKKLLTKEKIITSVDGDVKKLEFLCNISRDSSKNEN